jgi:hypothetical protein
MTLSKQCLNNVSQTVKLTRPHRFSLPVTGRLHQVFQPPGRTFLWEQPGGHENTSLHLLVHEQPVPKVTRETHSSFLWVLVWFGLMGLRFELRTSPLQSRHSIAWATPPVHFALVVWRWGLVNYLPRLALNRDLPDLSFLNSWDYIFYLYPCINISYPTN